MRSFHLIAFVSLAMTACAGSGTSTEQLDLNDTTSASDAPSPDVTTSSSSTRPPSSNSSSSTDQEVTTTTETAAVPVLDEPADPLARLLAESGANLGTAPATAGALEGAVLCNSSNDVDDTTFEEEQCFRDAIGSSQPAVLVVAFYTDEGDPIVRVQRALAASGTIRVSEDSSQDSFGAGGWRSYDCESDDLSRQPVIRNDSIFTC